MLDHLDLGIGAHRGDERALHLEPGRVAAGMHHAVTRVAAFAGQREIAPARGAVEGGAEGRQLAYSRRPFGHQQPHGRLVADPDPGSEGVAQVLLGVVLRPERRGDPALRPAGRSGVQQRLGDDHDRQPGARRACSTAASPATPEPDDDDVCRAGPSRRGR